MLKRKPHLLLSNSLVSWFIAGFKSIILRLFKSKDTRSTETRSSSFPGFLVLVWYFFAVFGTKITKRIMNSFPFTLTLNIVHVLVWCTMDWYILRRRKANFVFRLAVLRRCALNGIFLILATSLTLVSEELSPESLAHIVNSCGPLVSVITTTFWFGKRVPWNEILSLIPLALGVAMSGTSEIDFDYFGFSIAFIATVFTALHNTSGKIAMSLRNIDPLELHFYAGIVAVIGFFPLALILEARNIHQQSLDGEEHFVKRRLRLLSSTSNESSQIEFPLLLIALSSAILYVQSIVSLFVLERIPTVSYNVLNTFNKFVGIVLWIFYFPSNVQFENFVGMTLACSGFISYSYHNTENKRRNLAELKM